MSEQQYLICDLDGCLVNTAWIWQTVNLFKMDSDTAYDFFNKAANCNASRIDEFCLRYIYFKLAGGLKLHFLTARSEIIEVPTINFIQEKAGLIYGKDFSISFRAANDVSKSVESKEERLIKMLQDGKKIALAIDDKDDIIAMYLRHGIKTVKWLNGMLPVDVVQEYGDTVNNLLGKSEVKLACQN